MVCDGKKKSDERILSSVLNKSLCYTQRYFISPDFTDFCQTFSLLLEKTLDRVYVLWLWTRQVSFETCRNEKLQVKSTKHVTRSSTFFFLVREKMYEPFGL